MNRREFLQATGLLLVSGKILTDELIKYHKKDLESKIYELDKYVYLAKTHIDYGEGNEKDVEGCGIVLDNKYYTMAHIVNSNIVTYGRYSMELKIDSFETKINDKLLIPNKIDREKDVAIFDLPNDLHLDEFPCEKKYDCHLGERIYMIGNPRLKGWNIRSGRISDLDGVNKIGEPIEKMTKGCFGVDILTSYGDSGTPVVNEDYKLLGLTKSTFRGNGYIKKIGEFKYDKKD